MLPMMPDEMDPADALAKLLSERERAKRSVYAAHIAREKAEEERDWLIEMNTKRENLLVETESKLTMAIEEMADLKDKERARSQIIDAQQQKLDASEKRSAALKATLDRVQDELSQAYGYYGEESTSDPLPPIEELAETQVEETEEAASDPLPPIEELAETQVEETEEAAREEAEKPDAIVGGVKFFTRKFKETIPPGGIKAVLFGTRCARIRTLVVVASAPFLLMASLFVLASQGIYAGFFYDLMAGWWTPWMGTSEVKLGVFSAPIILAAVWYRLCRRGAPVETPEETEPDAPASPVTEVEDDEIGRQLDEVFGGMDEADTKQ